VPGGWPVLYPRRNIIDAIRYLDHNSCLWQTLPAWIQHSAILAGNGVRICR
jgi:putative transposase